LINPNQQRPTDMHDLNLNLFHDLLRFAPLVAFQLTDPGDLHTNCIINALVHRRAVAQSEKNFEMHKEWRKDDGCPWEMKLVLVKRVSSLSGARAALPPRRLSRRAGALPSANPWPMN
jgi:hypothetical protein